MRLHVGEPRRVQVRAGEKVIDDVGTEVRDGTLHVTFDHDGWGGNDVVVEASVPKLAGIDASGSGDIEADGIDADAFTLRSDGSADIVLTGSTAALDVEVDGSGDAELADLRARAATVKVRGSGDADVRADERLDVNVDGSGDVRYYGDPELNQQRRRLGRSQPRGELDDLPIVPYPTTTSPLSRQAVWPGAAASTGSASSRSSRRWAPAGGSPATRQATGRER